MRPSPSDPAGASLDRSARGPSYLDAARAGNGHWPYYVGGLLLILFAWLYLGGVLTIAVLAAVSPGTAPADLSTVGGAGGLAARLVAFIPFLLGVLAVVRWVHRRAPLSVVTARVVAGRHRIRPGRIALGAGVWAALVVLGTVIDALLNPGSYRFSFDASSFWPFALVALLLIPIQTSAEELLFRGYLAQFLSLATRNPVVLAAVGGILFAVPHLSNPEAEGGWWLAIIIFTAYGAGWTWVCVRDGSLELALGAHAANNLLAILVIGYDDAALPTQSLWTTNELNLGLAAVWAIVSVTAFVLVTRLWPPARVPS